MDIPTLVARAGDHLNVGRAFGPPYEHDGVLVIPVAVVVGGGGGGHQPASTQAEGGGFGGVVYPLGAYVIRQGNARFTPTYEATVLGVAVVSLLRFLVGRKRADQ